MIWIPVCNSLDELISNILFYLSIYRTGVLSLQTFIWVWIQKLPGFSWKSLRWSSISSASICGEHWCCLVQIPGQTLQRAYSCLSEWLKHAAVSRCGGDTHPEIELCFMLWSWAAQSEQDSGRGSHIFSTTALFYEMVMDPRESLSIRT